MTHRQQLQHYFNFDLWSTRKLADCLMMTDTFPNKPACTALLSHTLNIQFAWLHRIVDAPIPLPDRWEEHRLEEIKPIAKDAASYWINLVGDHDVDLSVDVYWQTEDGMQRTAPIHQICRHVIDHGQFHRAQIELMLHRGHCTVPETDYHHYAVRLPDQGLQKGPSYETEINPSTLGNA
ncbi:MAG: DinB family protein [Balneolaceae bacterium]